MMSTPSIAANGSTRGRKKYQLVPIDVTHTVSANYNSCAIITRGCSICCSSSLALRARFWKLILLTLLLLTVMQLCMNILSNTHQPLFTITHTGTRREESLSFTNSSQLLLPTNLNSSLPSKSSSLSQVTVSSSGKAEDTTSSHTSSHGSEGKNESEPKGGAKTLLSDKMERCPLIPPNLNGQVSVSTDVVSLPQEERLHPELFPGGHYRPPDCCARHKVALIVPYRAREQHLGIWLKHMHPYLQKQQLDYTIFVVEQAGKGKFNRAQLMNVGALESSKIYPFECYIFHDVDLLPEDDRNIYSCPQQPRHMSVAIDKLSYKLPYKAIFGGVSAMTTEHFKKLHGFSNRFWGWGGEDDDMSNRINHHGLFISRYPANIARYKMLTHRKEKANPSRFQTLKEGKKRFSNEGADTCKYNVLEISMKRLYTWIHVKLLKS